MTLIWIVLIPFIGGLLCMYTERFGEHWPRRIALLTMVAVTLIAAQLWLQGDFLFPAVGVAPHWTIEVQYPWIPRFGISLHLGLDGLSLLLILLTGIIGVLSVAASWDEVQKRIGFFHLSLLWMLGGIIGVFLALDLFLFFFFWEVMLIPMYFLIALWGHDASPQKTRAQAAAKFFIYTQASGMVMLLAIIGLVLVNYQNTGVFSFDYSVLRTAILTPATEYVLMLGFFVAFAVKLPIVPLHAWLPDAHEHAPAAGSADLAGLLLKTAAYGLIRFSLPLFPHASYEFAPIAMTLGCISIIYAAILAFAQSDMKRLIAYATVSHMGFVLIAIYAGQVISLQGAVLQMIAHGVSAAALFIICGQLYERIRTRNLDEMGGLWARMPLLPAFTLFFVLASLGLPSTGNFTGEFLILLGAFSVAPWTVVIASSGLVLASIYSLAIMYRGFFGMPKQADGPTLKPLVLREVLMLSSLVIMVIALGLYPQPILTTAGLSITDVRMSYPPRAAASILMPKLATSAPLAALPGKRISVISSAP